MLAKDRGSGATTGRSVTAIEQQVEDSLLSEPVMKGVGIDMADVIGNRSRDSEGETAFTAHSEPDWTRTHNGFSSEQPFFTDCQLLTDWWTEALHPLLHAHASTHPGAPVASPCFSKTAHSAFPHLHFLLFQLVFHFHCRSTLTASTHLNCFKSFLITFLLYPSYLYFTPHRPAGVGLPLHSRGNLSKFSYHWEVFFSPLFEDCSAHWGDFYLMYPLLGSGQLFALLFFLSC